MAAIPKRTISTTMFVSIVNDHTHGELGFKDGSVIVTRTYPCAVLMESGSASGEVEDFVVVVGIVVAVGAVIVLDAFSVRCWKSIMDAGYCRRSSDRLKPT